ncbi:MAG: TatD family hydrolase [bacterium]|nr:TatD family hydrolase [bacterium]
MLIDSHCHLDFSDFDSDRDEVIKRAYEGGIRKIINIGCDLNRAKKAIEIAENYDFIFAAVGLHPQEAESGGDEYFEEIKKLIAEPKVVAIGEIGLEFYGSSDASERRQKQKDVFLKHLALAGEFKKPVVIHCRNAYPEILEILAAEKKKNPGLAGVVHFFSGRITQAQTLFELGFLISFTGVITFVPKSPKATGIPAAAGGLGTSDYDKVIKAAPLDKIMVETDAPFAAPAPYRGQRNEPLYVKYVAEKIAEIKGLNFEETSKQTTENARNLFRI